MPAICPGRDVVVNRYRARARSAVRRWFAPLLSKDFAVSPGPPACAILIPGEGNRWPHVCACWQDSCPRCASTAMEEALLARRGTLWAWTTQAFPPPPPYAGPTGEDFVPFGVGYVELPGEVKVETRLTESDPDRLEHRHGDGARDRAVPHRRRRQRGHDLRVPARRLTTLRSEEREMDMDVAIIGVGLHPFGRFGGMTGIEMGAIAVRSARSPMPASSGATSSSRSAAATRSTTPTRSSRSSGLTGIPFTDVYNGCATAASAAHAGGQHHPPRRPRPRHRRRHGQAPAGRVQRRPAPVRVPAWYGEIGQFVTTKFFGMKINKYMHDHGISPRDAGQGGGQELPQRRRSTRTPSGASRCPRRRSSSRRCSTTR